MHNLAEYNFERADQEASAALRVWKQLAIDGNVKDATREFLGLCDVSFQYLQTRRAGFERRRHNMLTPDLEADELRTFRAFIDLAKAFASSVAAKQTN